MPLLKQGCSGDTYVALGREGRLGVVRAVPEAGDGVRHRAGQSQRVDSAGTAFPFTVQGSDALGVADARARPDVGLDVREVAAAIALAVAVGIRVRLLCKASKDPALYNLPLFKSAPADGFHYGRPPFSSPRQRKWVDYFARWRGGGEDAGSTLPMSGTSDAILYR